MKTPLFLVFTLLIFNAFGQNYSCISSQPKTYFTNNNNYLCGMRIDSIRNIDQNVVYYPFKTGRIKYPPLDNNNIIDTMGASWLGAAFIERPDGYTLINTFGNDTIFIKNNALLGESWTLYDDTSNISFRATITDIDTITVANVMDSVKTIRINTLNNGFIMQGDSLNNIDLMLSKSHGFIKVMPLYFFPFYNHQQPSYNFTYDFFLHSSSAHSYNEIGSLIFNLVDYEIKSYKLYDHEVGDFIVRKSCRNCSGLFNTSTDTIISKVISGDTTHYHLRTYYKNADGFNEQGVVWKSGINDRNYFVVRNVPEESNSKMPEEWYSDIQYYSPNDETYCFRSAFYGYEATPMMRNGQFNNFEPSSFYSSYKNGIGLFENRYFIIVDMTEYDEYVIGVFKNGVFCGTSDYILEDTSDTTNAIPFPVYPIPAARILNINLSNIIPQGDIYTIYLFDVLGKEKARWRGSNPKIEINIDPFSQGVYFLKIVSKKKAITHKIVIAR